MHIRRSTPNDIPAINRIYNQAVGEGLATADVDPLPLSFHENWYQQRDLAALPILVAESDHEVIGYNALSYYRYGRAALAHVRETSYYVEQNWRGRGIASKLMDAGIAACEPLGVNILLTFIIEGNTASVKMMDKLGFTVWGRLPQIIQYKGQVYDHLIFGKRL